MYDDDENPIFQTSSRVREIVEKLMACYAEKSPPPLRGRNLHVISQNQSVDVVWGTNSILEADLTCLNALYEINKVLLRIITYLAYHHDRSVIVLHSSLGNCSTYITM